jgi:hypothetical protein
LSTFNREPIRAESRIDASYIMVDGEDALFLHAPGEVVFQLVPGDRKLSGRFGLRDGAWESGITDGVEFSVAVNSPGRPAAVIWRRMLRPVTNSADRGEQSFVIKLPAGIPAGSTLTIGTGVGPNNDGRCDWSYITGVKFE